LIPNSLRFRLLGAAVAVIVLAVQVAGLFVVFLFERNVIRLVQNDLDSGLDQLTAALTHDAEGLPLLKSELPDVRFRQRLAGRYWQVALDGRPVLRSPSLGEGELQVPAVAEAKGGAWRQGLVGPDEQKLYASIRRLTLKSASPAPGEHPRNYLLIVAMDVAEIATLDALNTQLRGNMFTALGVLALILIAAAWAQVSVGLHPLEMLRTGVENIRVGKARRMSDDVPTELQPLVTEANRLLEGQEKALEAARARAGDLAHGLKTPLTALGLVAEKLRQLKEHNIAGELDQQLKGLAAHVERELARTRMAANAAVTQRTLVHPIATRLLRTMEKLPHGDRIRWSLDCRPDFVVPVEEVDLAEVLGNLLDNARKWARSKVTMTARSAASRIELAIEDDGPGVSEADYARVLRRGTRLDESVPGSGLGLNIARAVVEAYGGRLALEKSAACGGLLVRLSLPRQHGGSLGLGHGA
jgi:signal transduction histidine kinase